MTIPSSPIWVSEPCLENDTNAPPVEEWRNIEGIIFTDEAGTEHVAYQVSNFGNVKALQRPGMRREFLVAQWIKMGRPYVTLKIRKSVTRSIRVDELVLNAFLGPRPGPTWGAAYRDGDKTNVELSNLSWERGAGKAGRHRRGKPSRTRRSTPTPDPVETQAPATEPAPEPDSGISVEIEVGPTLQEWHRYVIGDLEVLTTPEGIEISRLDDESEVIASVNLSWGYGETLRRLLDRVL